MQLPGWAHAASSHVRVCVCARTCVRVCVCLSPPGQGGRPPSTYLCISLVVNVVVWIAKDQFLHAELRSDKIVRLQVKLRQLHPCLAVDMEAAILERAQPLGSA